MRTEITVLFLSYKRLPNKRAPITFTALYYLPQLTALMGRCTGCCLNDSSAIWKLRLCHLLWLQTQKTAPQRGENVWKLVFCPLTTVSRLTFYSFPPGLFCIVRKKLMCLCSERSSVQLLLWIEWHVKSRISYAVCSFLLIPTHKFWNLKACTLVLSYAQTEASSKLWLIVTQPLSHIQNHRPDIIQIWSEPFEACW